MCSRFTQVKDEVEIARRDKIEKFGLVPRYNIAPGSRVPIFIEDAAGFRLVEASWGWKDQRVGLHINARGEKIADTWPFRSFTHQRCLIPMDSFYERLASPQPIRFLRADESYFFVAGLWRVYQRQPEDIVIDEHAFVLITTEPNASVARWHDRMPCVLQPDHLHWWTKPDAGHDPGKMWELCLSHPDQTEFNWHPVGKAVSNSRNTSPDLIRAVPLERELF